LDEGLKHSSGRLVLVLGMHRSGTSAVAEAVVRLGVSCGEGPRMMEGDQWNPRGYFEDVELIACNDAILEEMGAHWAGPPERVAPAFSPSGELSRRVQALVEKVAGKGRAHMWKDPRLCVTLPVWGPSLACSPTVIVWRHPWEVAQSVRARDGLPLEASALLWEVYTRGALANTARMPRMLVDYAAMTSDPEPTVEKLGAFLLENGIIDSKTAVKQASTAVDPKLRRQRDDTKAQDFEKTLTSSQQRLLASLNHGKMEAPDYGITRPSAGGYLQAVAMLQRANADRIRLGAEKDRFERSYNYIMSRPLMRIYQAVKRIMRRTFTRRADADRDM